MRTEKVLAALFLLTCILRLNDFSWGYLAQFAVLFVLLFIYFIGGFYFFTDPISRKQKIGFAVVSGILLSMVPLGVLFTVSGWEGSEMYLPVGILISFILFGVSMARKRSSSEELQPFYRNMMVRTAVLGLVALFLYVTPSNTLEKVLNLPSKAELDSIRQERLQDGQRVNVNTPSDTVAVSLDSIKND